MPCVSIVPLTRAPTPLRRCLAAGQAALTGAFRRCLDLPSQAAYHQQPATQQCDPLLVIAAHRPVILVIKSVLCFLEEEVDGTDERSPHLLAAHRLRGRTDMPRGHIGHGFSQHATPFAAFLGKRRNCDSVLFRVYAASPAEAHARTQCSRLSPFSVTIGSPREGRTRQATQAWVAVASSAWAAEERG
jgi:hypothetical protein